MEAEEQIQDLEGGEGKHAFLGGGNFQILPVILLSTIKCDRNLDGSNNYSVHGAFPTIHRYVYTLTSLARATSQKKIGRVW